MQLIVNTETPSSALERVGGRIKIRNRYDNFIGGAWVPPAQGRYFENRTPISGEVVCEIARSTAEDIETALDQLGCESPCVRHDLVLVGAELLGHRQSEADGLGGDHVHQGPTLHAGESGLVDRLGLLLFAEDES